MDDSRPPPRFIRLLCCCTGPEELRQDDNSFVQIGPVQDVAPVQPHSIPDNLSSVRNSPAHDADADPIPVPDDPSFVQIGSSHDSDPDVHMVPDVPSSSTTQDASNSKKSSSCRYAKLENIKDQLISGSPLDLKVVPIVGMGGIGKTTLAKALYEDAAVSRQFHLRAWIAISQDYNLENVLPSLLRSVDPDRAAKASKQKDADLEQALYQSLKGRRYLIVLDDIWNDQTWNDFKSIFPNDKNGSRILLTTRLVEVALSVEKNRPPHCLDCLSHKESWMLLQTQVFHGKACPSDLEEIGKEIAKKCQGLPLAIVVVAGNLSNIDKKQDSWADVAKRMITGSEEQILDILYLSYDHLPQHLKKCFLYMSIFPKNSEIHLQKLIMLWSAVGISQSKDEAEQCLKDLINRNLIMVKHKKYGRDRTCGIHDLLWDLSLREAQNEGHHAFDRFNPKHTQINSTTYDMNHLLMYLTSSYLYRGHSFGTNFPCRSICFSLLTVLDIQRQIFDDFPEIITKLVGLRYLELRSYIISRSVSKFLYLETFINRYTGSYELPREIFLLGRLRHLQAGRAVYLKMIPGNNYILETLSSISFRSCKYIDFSRIPNLKKLKIVETNEWILDKTTLLNLLKGKNMRSKTLFNRLKGLVKLPQLEKLTLEFSDGILRRRPYVHWPDLLPRCLKQLTLSGICLQWKNLNILAEFPNIEVLKLKNDAFLGPVYEQTVEGFTRLKVLVFEHLRLSSWIAEAVHYPVLQYLVLRGCYSLTEIPLCFVEIETLMSIELDSCGRSTENSAKAIQEEQHSNGNYDLQLSITCISNSEDEIVPPWSSVYWESENDTTDSEDEIVPPWSSVYWELENDTTDSEDEIVPECRLWSCVQSEIIERTLGQNINRTGLEDEITDSTNMIYRTDSEVETTDSEYEMR